MVLVLSKGIHLVNKMVVSILIRSWLLLAFGAILLSACEQETAPRKIGVFANTNVGILEISPHKTDFPYKISLSDSEFSQMSKVSSLNYFYVNVPEILIAETKLIWFSSFEKEERSYDKGRFDYKLEDVAELKPEIEKLKNGLYKIRFESISDKETGFVALHLRMPYGTTDRAYLIRIE